MSKDVFLVTYKIFFENCKLIAEKWEGKNIDGVYGIPQGGIIPAIVISGLMNVPLVTGERHDKNNVLVIDDIVDSGKTMERHSEFFHNMAGFDCIISKKCSLPSYLRNPFIKQDTWVKFWWEKSERPQDSIVRLIQYIGEDPTRDGLIGTPTRVCRAFLEMNSGYKEDIKKILSSVFSCDNYDEMIVLKGVSFTSTCEHHLMPFMGKATIGYIPNGNVIGISKLVRLLNALSKRLQIQERLTKQIGDEIVENLKPLGVGVILKAHHSCMSCRGVKQKETEMVTSFLNGVIRDDERARNEFLRFL